MNPGAIASFYPDSREYVESSIFTVNAQGGITAVWMNYDGTGRSPNYEIYATGDPVYLTYYPQVTLKFV